MTSLISAIRGAISGAQPPLPIDGEPDAFASLSETPLNPEAQPPGGDMSGNQTVPGATSVPGAIAAITAASQGGADGIQAAMERINTILSAEGIKADGNRMDAARQLAMEAPGMSAEQVVAFVTANVPAATATAAPVEPSKPNASYEQKRLAASHLAMPGGGQPTSQSTPKLNATTIYAMRREALKGA